MALKNAIKFISQSKSGREITIKDDTGLEVYGKLTGYGSTNGSITSIKAYHIILSRIDNNNDQAIIKIDNTNNKLPTISQLANGASLNLTSALLEDNGSTKLLSSKMFNDGVVDINMYVQFEEITGLTITKGTNFIVGTIFTDTLKGDAILVNNIIYQIDKSKYTNGDSVLYIIGYFKDDSTKYSILYRANIKILLLATTDSMHAYVTKNIVNNKNISGNQSLSYGLCLKQAAISFFNDIPADYITANDMILLRYNILKCL